ncbi:uncharacterized protein [Antennarius striatus]|uniref:uncharacterized protein n=1 Tax=Antennarius striatus TaxID=241820 RepID=UPI0035ADB2A1
MAKPRGTLLVSLVLVLTCGGAESQGQDFCRGLCPNFQELEPTTNGVLRRWSNETNWITTRLASRSLIDGMSSHNTLKSYWGTYVQDVLDTDQGTWPVLLSSTKSVSETNLWLSWYLPTSETMAPDPEGRVFQMKLHAGVMYYQVSEDHPHIGDEDKIKDQMLERLGFHDDEIQAYHAALYDPVMAWEFHSEVWIFAADHITN